MVPGGGEGKVRGVQFSYRIEGEGGGDVSGARVDSPLVVRCRLEALLGGLPQQTVQLLTLPYHLQDKGMASGDLNFIKSSASLLLSTDYITVYAYIHTYYICMVN